MYWWLSGIVLAVGVVGLLAAAAVALPRAARLRREVARLRRDVAAATAGLRSGSLKMGVRRVGGPDGPGA